MKGIVKVVCPTTTREYEGKVYYDRLLVINPYVFDAYTGEPRVDERNFVGLVYDSEEGAKSLDSLHVGDVIEVDFHLKGNNSEKNGEFRNFTKAIGHKPKIISSAYKPAEAVAPVDPFENGGDDTDIFG